MSWQDGEPQQPGGCAYVDVDGAWRTTSCDTKLQGAMCGGNSGELRRWKGGQDEGLPGRTLGHFLNSTPLQGPLLLEE